MEKEFIPYEQAFALKELGFDERCFGFYENKMLKPTSYVSDFKNGTNHNVDIDNVFKLIPAPLYQQAFRWFREKYGIHSTIHLLIINPKIYESSIKNDLGEIVLMKEFNTYEKAELECLRKLIEIVKT
jgi:hypothetical protein